MPFNGTGTFSVYTPGNPVVTGTTISSTVNNNTNSDFATGLSTCITKNGQTTITANLPMSTFRHTGVGAASATTDYARADQVQNSSLTYLTNVSGADTITADAAITPAAYAAGQQFSFISAGANTGAVTLNVSGLGAKDVTKSGTTALVSGDIASGATVTVIYDGTQFQLVTANIGNFATLGANTFTGDQTITSTDAGATAGPALDLYRNSTSPAANDLIGYIPFNGKDSGGAKQTYGSVFGEIIDQTAASEDGRIGVSTTIAGTTANRLYIGDGIYTAGVTGGDKGSNTVNATTYYIAGNQLLESATNSLSGDVNLNNTGSYFTGPSVAQGSSGTWFATGTVCFYDSATANAAFNVKLWDGTTVIASAYVVAGIAGAVVSCALSGYLATPAGNIRISVQDTSSTNGAIRYNASGNSKDSTLSVFRVG